MFILEGDEEEKHPMISRQKLIRLIRQMEPGIVAVDNMHELSPSRSDLVRLLKQMPPTTKLVQVTGGERPEALTRIARRCGISFDRLNPLEEAETGARLAAKGIGHVVSAFEDRTWIKVSRRRSPGRGGWSQKRYTRKIHGSVKGLAREIEEELRQSGFQFSSKALEGLGGYIRCVFVVEAPRHRVHIKPGCRGDAQVRIEGVERPRLKFEPLNQKRGYIIAGIDPGTTTGIAALNLRGELVDLLSTRAISPSDVIEWLAERGKPLIVAADVVPAPGAVEKVKRSFNAVLYTPGEDIPSEDKIALAKGYGYRNDHERDSLAAAVSAYKKYKNKFQQVEKKCPPELDPNDLKALVVKGRSIDQAISELVSHPSEDSHQEKTVKEVDSNLAALNEKNRRQADQIRWLKELVEDLKKKLAKKERELRKRERAIDRLKDRSSQEIKRDREIKIRNKEIKRLRGLLRLERKKNRRLKSRLNLLKRAEKLEKAVVGRQVKEIETFSRDAVLEGLKQWNTHKGDVIFLADASGGGPHTADLFIEKEIDAVITDNEMTPSVRDYLMDHDLPVVPSQKVPVRKVAGIAFIDPRDLEDAKTAWAEEKRLRAARLKTELLEEIIQEYRAERRKDERQMRQKHQ
ncbi:MAG: DUF460 domain-containing protein [Methanotrichaceae archaeon]